MHIHDMYYDTISDVYNQRDRMGQVACSAAQSWGVVPMKNVVVVVVVMFYNIV